MFDNFPDRPQSVHGGARYDEGFNLQAKPAGPHGVLYDEHPGPTDDPDHGAVFDEWGWKEMPEIHGGFIFDQGFKDETAHETSRGELFDLFEPGTAVRYVFNGQDAEGIVDHVADDRTVIVRPSNGNGAVEVDLAQFMAYRSPSMENAVTRAENSTAEEPSAWSPDAHGAERTAPPQYGRPEEPLPQGMATEARSVTPVDWTPTERLKAFVEDLTVVKDGKAAQAILAQHIRAHRDEAGNASFGRYHVLQTAPSRHFTVHHDPGAGKEGEHLGTAPTVEGAAALIHGHLRAQAGIHRSAKSLTEGLDVLKGPGEESIDAHIQAAHQHTLHAIKFHTEGIMRAPKDQPEWRGAASRAREHTGKARNLMDDRGRRPSTHPAQPHVEAAHIHLSAALDKTHPRTAMTRYASLMQAHEHLEHAKAATANKSLTDGLDVEKKRGDWVAGGQKGYHMSEGTEPGQVSHWQDARGQIGADRPHSKIGSSRASSIGNVAAAYHYANGQTLPLGRFASHQHAHAAIVGHHESLGETSARIQHMVKTDEDDLDVEKSGCKHCGAASHYVHRERDDAGETGYGGREGWVGPIRSHHQAQREADAWVSSGGGWRATVHPSSPEVKARVKAWVKGRQATRKTANSLISGLPSYSEFSGQPAVAKTTVPSERLVRLPSGHTIVEKAYEERHVAEPTHEFPSAVGLIHQGKRLARATGQVHYTHFGGKPDEDRVTPRKPKKGQSFYAMHPEGHVISHTWSADKAAYELLDVAKEVTVAESAIQAAEGAAPLSGTRGAGSYYCPECRATKKELSEDGRCPDCNMVLAAHTPGKVKREKGDGSGAAEDSEPAGGVGEEGSKGDKEKGRARKSLLDGLDVIKGRTTTPTHRIEFHPSSGFTPSAWRSRSGPNQTGYGKPTDDNLHRHIRGIEASTREGGVNAHLGPTKIRGARIVHQGTGEHVAHYGEGWGSCHQHGVPGGPAKSLLDGLTVLKAFGSPADPLAGGQTVTTPGTSATPARRPGPAESWPPGDQPEERGELPEDHQETPGGNRVEYCPHCGEVLEEEDEKTEQGAPAHKCVEDPLALMAETDAF